jgi:hypothetical protein
VSGLDAALDELGRLSSTELKSRWSALVGGPAPRISPKLLRMALAWEMQARALGGLSRETSRTLDQLARGATRTQPTRAGMRLVRVWAGQTHVVTVDDEGVIHWNAQQWSSLSEVARAITGTRWSGPAFFGLKRKAAA